MSVTLLTSHEDISILKLLASSNISSISKTLLTSHEDISLLKLLASSNISFIFITLLTSQFEISPLKPVFLNSLFMSVTSETTYCESLSGSSIQGASETKSLKISSDTILYSLPSITPLSPEIPQS